VDHILALIFFLMESYSATVYGFAELIVFFSSLEHSTRSLLQEYSVIQCNHPRGWEGF